MSTSEAKSVTRAGSYFLYPAALGLAVTGLLLGIGRGMPHGRVIAVVLMGAVFVVSVLERARPHCRAWNEDHGDRMANWAYLVINVTVSQVAAIMYGLQAPLTGNGLALWPTGLPLAVQVLLALVVVDLGLYSVHRLSHKVQWLWRLHAIHHTSSRLYWVNGQRRHVVHELLEGTPGLLVLGTLGAPPSVVACSLAIVTVHLLLQHGNIEYRAGALRHVFAVAELHRWHHQRRYEAVQGNYGAVFSVWDRLFGTALPEVGVAPLDVGMDDEPTLPKEWLAQQVWPFRRP